MDVPFKGMGGTRARAFRAQRSERPRLRRPARLGLLLGFLVALIPARPAGAHPNLERAEPAENASVAASPGRITVVLTEEATPVSRLSLVGPGGERVKIGPTRVAGTKLEADVGPLAPGDHTVRFAAFSAEDGHLVAGRYRFRVGPGRLAETRSGGALSSAIAAVWSRLMVLGGGLLWAAGLLLALLVARPGARRAPFGEALGQRLRRLAPWAVAAALTGELTTLWIAYRAGLAVWTADFLLGSGTGRLALARLVALGGGLAVSLWLRPSRRSPTAQLPFTLAYLGLLSFSGHAALSPAGPLSGPLLDGVHLLASAAWLGGITLFGLALGPGARDARGVAELARRFSPVALVAAATLGITGTFATEQQTVSLSDLSETLYGRLLVAKLLLVGLLVAMSVRVGFLLRPALVHAALAGDAGRDAPESPEEARLASKLLANLRLEVPVAVAIIVSVALMTSRASPLTLATGSRSEARPGAPAPIFARQEMSGRAVSLSVLPGAVGRNRVVVAVEGLPVDRIGLRVDRPGRPGPSSWVPVEDGVSATEVDFPSAGVWTARVTVAGGEAEIPLPIGDRAAAGDALEVLTVADLRGPARERCRQQVVGQQVALAQAERPLVLTVIDPADLVPDRLPGKPSILLGGCGADEVVERIAEERGIPLLAPDGGDGGTWSWALEPPPDAEGRAMARIGSEALKARSAAIAFQPGDRFEAAARVFQDQFSSAGATVQGLWEVSSGTSDVAASEIASLQVELLILFGSPEAMGLLVRDLDGRGWRPAKFALAGSSLLGPELPDAAPNWRDGNVFTMASYYNPDVELVSPYVAAVLDTVPGEVPSQRGLLGYVKGRLLLEALDGVGRGASREELRRALDSGFRKGWELAEVDLEWGPGRHQGAGEVALFRITRPLNVFGLLGGAAAGHAIGGVLYENGDFTRYTSFYGASGKPRPEA